mgnify:CR=1 FL=1
MKKHSNWVILTLIGGNDLRIGVFVCHCGRNISSTVDVSRVVREVSERSRKVVFSTDYKYLCSDPGQKLIEEKIKEENLDAVVIAACSPSMHEETFRRVLKRAGINEYLLEIANIREQCSWVHEDGTEKAIALTLAAVEKVSRNEKLKPIKIGVKRKCLVIGGGIAGITASLDLANSGFEVILVEKSPTIGGKMAQLSETFPTLDCSQCILTPLMVSLSRNDRIKLYTMSEVVEIDGYVGNFRVKIKKKPRYVIEEKCTVCGECEKVCPVIVPNEFDRGLSYRKAIYIPFPQAVPSSYVIDPNSCLGLNPVVCGKCKEVCEADAIDYHMREETIEEEVGAIIVATGYELFPKDRIGEYGYGTYEDVIDALEFERILSSTGPTGGTVKRPSDGKTPKRVVFIQCAGSRDENYLEYCSKICCMYTAKQAMLYKHLVPEGEAYVFYIDVRTAGKGYEEFFRRVQEEEGVIYIRGKVSRVYREGENLIVEGVDTLTGKKLTIEADLVVLSTGVVPPEGTENLVSVLKIQQDQSGFLKEAHPKLKPTETLTKGIFICGAIQGPKDITETVSQAKGAASAVMELLSMGEVERDPIVARVNEEYCVACKTCESLCPFGAVKVRDKAEVNEALCEGCGICAASCPTGAIEVVNNKFDQFEEVLEVLINGREKLETENSGLPL